MCSFANVNISVYFCLLSEYEMCITSYGPQLLLPRVFETPGCLIVRQMNKILFMPNGITTDGLFISHTDATATWWYNICTDTLSGRERFNWSQAINLRGNSTTLFKAYCCDAKGCGRFAGRKKKCMHDGTIWNVYSYFLKVSSKSRSNLFNSKMIIYRTLLP